MNARRVSAALAISCACLWPAQAIGQQQQVYGPTETPRPRTAPTPGSEQRPAATQQPPAAPPMSMIESWSLGDNAQVGLGRFRVMEMARPRTNIERERAPLTMDRPTRPIMGAGLSIRF